MIFPENQESIHGSGPRESSGAFDRAIADYGAAIAKNAKDAKDAGSLYGRGVAKLRSGDTAGGEADIAAAKAIEADIVTVYAGYGAR